MKIVLDTNILFVILSPTAKNRWILEKFLNYEFTLCLTTDMLAEYEEIITQHMGIAVFEVFLSLLSNQSNVELVTNYFRWNLIVSDPDDNKFVDCAITCNAHYIVTHDKHFNILKQIPFPKVQVIDVLKFRTLFDD